MNPSRLLNYKKKPPISLGKIQAGKLLFLQIRSLTIIPRQQSEALYTNITRTSQGKLDVGSQ